MGTRSTTTIKSSGKNSKTLCTIYRQYDGYLSGHGKELKDGFGNTKIVNGFNGDMKAPDSANGMGCLAAQIIAKLKDGIGNIYIAEPDETGEEYDYLIYTDGKDLFVRVDDYDGLLKDLPTDGN